MIGAVICYSETSAVCGGGGGVGGSHGPVSPSPLRSHQSVVELLGKQSTSALEEQIIFNCDTRY